MQRLSSRRSSVAAVVLRPLLALIALLWFNGCRTFHDSQQQLHSLYDTGRPHAALKLIDDLRSERRAEHHILAVDQAVLKLMVGQTEDVVRELETLKRDLDYVSQQDASEQILAGLKDDTAITWSGRTFERRMVDNLQLLSGIILNDSDTFALATRSMAEIHREQRQGEDRTPVTPIEDVVEENFSGSEGSIGTTPSVNRFTAYLAAAVHSERMQDSDLTDRLIQQAGYPSTQAGSNTSDIQQLGTRTSKGSGTLQVITFSGRVTSWEPEKVMPTSAALLIADRVLSAVGDHTLPATVSAVRIARPIQPHADSLLRTQVIAGPSNEAKSQVLVDVNANAWESYKADRDEQIARAVVRRVLKKGAVYTLKNSMNVEKESGTDFLLNLAGGLWESFEKADLRHCELLPAAIELAQLELPAGDHQITLQVVPCNGTQEAFGREQLQVPITIEDGRNTFIVCFRPREKLVGIQNN